MSGSPIAADDRDGLWITTSEPQAGAMRATDDERIDAAFHVPLDQHWLQGLVHGWPRLWTWLGEVESRILRGRLEEIKTERPIYIAGLARSGSTILLEFLAAHPHVATHKYRDFPPVFTPYWWRALQRHVPRPSPRPAERAHGDGLMITPESPEAMEEPIWMAFFPHTHDPAISQVLDERTRHPEFAHFYRDHIRKILLIRGGRRYASKGNYNVSRLPYLLKLFPDAKVVIPIRHPRTHVASLMKQHRRFTCGESRHPRALARMRRLGHFEFGLDRRLINTGDAEAIRQVYELWESGEDVRGWARYWAHLYGWVAGRLEHDETLRRAARVIRFENLCDDPQRVLTGLLQHCDLPDEGLVWAFQDRIHAPTYYRPDFSPDDEAIIAEETHLVAARFGYHET